ncbi:MAG TPA: hypothetical protein VJ400_08440 [Thermoplasmata archaeon]|nr:hypothetical protein [Thermoplasmata archaeon]
MAQPGTERASSRAVNPNYRTNMEILTRSGGIVWGFVLLIGGVIWFAASAGWISLGTLGNLILPFLVVVAGIYILVTKMMR